MGAWIEIAQLTIDKYNDYIDIINQIKHCYNDENSFIYNQLSRISDNHIDRAIKDLKDIDKTFDKHIQIEQRNNMLHP